MSVSKWTALRWYFLRAGLPIGAMLGFGLAYTVEAPVWWDIIPTTVISTIATAAAFTWICQGVVRSHHRKGLSNGEVVMTAVFLAPMCGFALWFLLGRLPHGRWVALPELPSAAGRFTGPTCFIALGDGPVIMTARAGGYLIYHPGRDRPGIWQQTDAIPDSVLARQTTCPARASLGFTPFRPARALDSYRIDDDASDCAGTRQLILTSDNRVWQWSTGGCALLSLLGGGFLLVATVIIGGIVGTLRLNAQFLPWDHHSDQAVLLPDEH